MGDRDLGLRYWQSRRWSRRRFLGTAAAGGAALAGIGLVGCGGGNKSSGNPSPQTTTVINDGTQDGTGKPGGILRTRQAADLPNMNPFGPSIFALAQGLFLGFTVFDHMWYVPTDTGEIELFLATNVEQPDELTVKATLGDATFHDRPPVNGRAVRAQDVAASFLRFREEIPFGYTWLHHVMDTIEAPDDKTVVIKQKFPWAWVFTSSNAGSPWTASILPEEILHDTDFLNKDAIGSGHWMLEGHDNGRNVRLRKFPNFRVPGQPLLDGIDFKSITNEAAELAAFKAGEIDTVGFQSREEMQDTERQLGDRIVTGSDLSRSYLCLMVKYEEPFVDERVRKALNLLIDREEAILLLKGGDGVKCGPVPPAHKVYALPEDDPDMQEYFRSDVAEAKKLLEAAEFPLDQEFELKHATTATNSNLAQVLKEQLARGGVKVKLVPEDLVKWFSQSLGQSNFQMTAFEHIAYEDPDLPLRMYLSAEGDRKNFMQYGDADVDAAILAAAQELDEEARIEKTKEAQRVVMKKYAPMFNIMSEINFGGRYSYVKGVITGRGSYGLFNRTTWLDKS